MYIVQRDTVRGCPAIDWVITGFGGEFRGNLKTYNKCTQLNSVASFVVSWAVSTADLCLRWQSASIDIR